MTFPTFLASFITMGLPLLLIAAGVILVLKSRTANRSANARFYFGVLLRSLPLGLVAYLAAGMIAAILRGGGHFYSVPFGGYTASNDAALVSSAVVWIALVLLA